MEEERQFYVVPEGLPTVRCHQCKQVIPVGDKYFMTDDDSWIFCHRCASAKEKPHGPKQRLYEPRERVPLHKKRTLREQQYG